ncbi:MAG: S9 family peptidase, partial [Gammaproteobacteria bacterium]|nr:S9 family peptidase [Gammaproteobacteria bacterium]
ISTDELYAVNYDGKLQTLLLGCGYEAAVCIRYPLEVIDMLREDPRVLIAARYLENGRSEPYLINVISGKRMSLGAPLSIWSRVVADHNGQIRLSIGTDDDGNTVVHYREKPGAEWSLFDKFPISGGGLTPVMFTKDNQQVYVEDSRQGEGGFKLYNLATKEFTHLSGHEIVESDSYIFDHEDYPFAVTYMDGIPKARVFEKDSRAGKILEVLENSFPGQYVTITSWTWDGKELIFLVQSDQNPGEFYLFNTETMQAQYLMSRMPWIKPDQIAKRTPISVAARDGLMMHGYLTTPLNQEKENLPLIVLPHGGPHGPRDKWFFDFEAALFADRGYAVLQINFRGSGGYGKAFEKMGYRKWGREMQDDITDATFWAIKEGVADPDRICIYGASYGGYAALMGVIREPDLYKCAVGYVGVYDLPLMHRRGDVQSFEAGKAVLREYLGTDDADLRARSPVHHVNKIKVPLFIVHGKRDIRAHYAHYEKMIDALDDTDIKYDSLVKRNEAHGFYNERNREELYTKMLAFFDRHIGD